MKIKNGDLPLHPTLTHDSDTGFLGITKREYFAAMAMQGLLSNPNWDYDKQYAAEYAIHEADQLLNALES